MLNEKPIALRRLILASGSPRRAEILTSVGWDFVKFTADIDETELESEDPVDYVRRLAKTKAETVAARVGNGLVLGADTTVVVDGEIIGKPVDTNDAANMLRKLSGRWHEVLTGVALVSVTDGDFTTRVEFERTRVEFSVLSEAEIEFLVEFGSPLDKAGAYAVQAQAALFINRIEGDYWNVVGLPVQRVYKMLTER